MRWGGTLEHIPGGLGLTRGANMCAYEGRWQWRGSGHSCLLRARRAGKPRKTRTAALARAPEQHEVSVEEARQARRNVRERGMTARQIKTTVLTRRLWRPMCESSSPSATAPSPLPQHLQIYLCIRSAVTKMKYANESNAYSSTPFNGYTWHNCY